jgi:hypothetical protein
MAVRTLKSLTDWAIKAILPLSKSLKRSVSYSMYLRKQTAYNAKPHDAKSWGFFLSQKNLKIFKILEHFTLPYVVVYMGGKKVFLIPKSNIIDREKNF